MKTNTNSDSELKARSAQQGKREGQFPKIDFAKRQANRKLPTGEVLKLLQKEAPLLFRMARIVGKWVWIQFQEKQPRQITAILSQIGFHWNNRRQLWQHPCGIPSEPGIGNYDPRERYGNRATA